MQKILLCWEIRNIIIHSNNGNIKTLVSWSTKLTAPIVRCWYGRSNSVCWGGGRLHGRLKNWQEKMTNAIRNLSNLFYIQHLTVFLLVIFIH